MARRAGQSAGEREREREAAERWEARPPAWVVRLLPEGESMWRLWATRSVGGGPEGVGEDLTVRSVLWQRGIVADLVGCDDPRYVVFEIDPPIESVLVEADCMTRFVACLRRNGYHARCTECGTGREYEF